MPRTKPGPESAKCACGNLLTEAAAFVHRSAKGVYVYHRCKCGQEWTETRSCADRSTPVSTDEVLDVHRFLGDFRGGLPDLLPTEPPLL